jgi:hypothetical protein
MDTVYNGFFNLLNQLILLGFSLITVDGRNYCWLGLPFIILLFGLNGWAILVWRTNGLTEASKFYSVANMRCFMALALLGLLSAATCTAASALSHFSN